MTPHRAPAAPKPTMLLCFTNRLLGVEPLLVSGSEVMVVGEASLELG